jgi:hypothetical protein
MLSIELPSGVFITVGWLPELDPKGEYRLHVCQDTFDDQIELPIHTKNYTEVVEAIYNMIAKYMPRLRLASSPGASAHAIVNGKVANDLPLVRLLSTCSDRTVTLMLNQ